MRFARIALVFACAILLTAPAAAQKWGTIKGKFTFGGANVPKLDPLNVTVDKDHCLSKGPIPNEEWVIDPATKGVKNVMVWIAVEEDGKANHTKAVPIHPSLANFAKTPATMDQPCCKFEPRIMGIQVGQTFIGKNTSPKPHNINMIGGPLGATALNQIVAPGNELTKDKGWKAWHLPANVSCNIHPWMKAYIFAFPHPYFATTNEKGEFEIKNVPAGKFRIVGWQESVGYTLGGKDGKAIEVKADQTTDAGEVKIAPK